MLFAGAAAIKIAGACGEEAAEDAMLGVEDGQVLVGDELDASGIGGAGDLDDLFRVAIVSGRETLEAHVEQEARGDGVGGVEAEIAGEMGMALEAIEEASSADEKAGVDADEEVGDLVFAGLQDAGAGDARGDAGGFEFFE